MRKRNKQLNIRLAPEELAQLRKNAQRAKLPVSNYVRALIAGNSPRECPPIEYDRLMQHLQKSISVFGDIRDAVCFSADMDDDAAAALDAQMQAELICLHTTLLELQQSLQTPDKAVL